MSDDALLFRLRLAIDSTKLAQSMVTPVDIADAKHIIATIEQLRAENQKLRTDLYYIEQRYDKACRELDRRDELEAANDAD